MIGHNLKTYISLSVLVLFTVGCEKVQFEQMDGVVQSIATDDELCEIHESPNCPDAPDLPSPTPTPGPNPDPTPVPPPPTPNPDPTPVPPSPTPVPVPPVPETVSTIDEFTQITPVVSSGKVDILIVEDTSLSMREERWTLYKRFPGIFQTLSTMDWQMGITTTAMDTKWSLNGELYPWNMYGDSLLSQKFPNFERAFTATIGFGMCSIDDKIVNWHDAEPCTSGNEQALKATVKSIQRYANSENFFRKNANVAIVYLSDEDEKNLYGPETTANDVLDEFSKLFGNDKKMKAYGAIIQPGDGACLKDQSGPFAEPDASYGFAIDDLVRKTGGQTVSICDRDFSSLFDSIKKDFSGDSVGGEPLFKKVQLKHTPVSLESVHVRLTPAANIPWTLQGNEIIFDVAPPAGTKIQVGYDYLVD